MKKYFLLFVITPLMLFSQRKDIVKVLETQQKGWNNGDLESYMEGYWKSDSLMFIGSRGVTYG